MAFLKSSRLPTVLLIVGLVGLAGVCAALLMTRLLVALIRMCLPARARPDTSDASSDLYV